MVLKVWRSAWELKIDTERLQEKKNNQFEEGNVARKDCEHTRKRHAIITAYLRCAMASPK